MESMRRETEEAMGRLLADHEAEIRRLKEIVRRLQRDESDLTDSDVM
jgi:exonuclease VII small subunit